MEFLKKFSLSNFILMLFGLFSITITAWFVVTGYRYETDHNFREKIEKTISAEYMWKKKGGFDSVLVYIPSHSWDKTQKIAVVKGDTAYILKYGRFKYGIDKKIDPRLRRVFIEEKNNHQYDDDYDFFRIPDGILNPTSPIWYDNH